MDRLVLPTVVVDFQREELRGPSGSRIDLRPRAFAVLRCLAAHAERLVTKDDLLAECWPGIAVTEESLAQCVSEIRQALGDGARDVIRTVPRRGYMLMPPSSASRLTLAPIASLAVLPFDEFADNAGPLGAGLAAELIAELARDPDLAVLARHASFGAVTRGMLPSEIANTFRIDFVLEGNIRSAGNDCIVNAQLIDGRDSRHVWTERFRAPIHDLFVEQSGLVARIAALIFDAIVQVRRSEALRRAPDDLNATELTLLGMAQLRKATRATVIAGRAALHHAISLDPNYGLARIFLGTLNATDAAYSLTGEVEPEVMLRSITDIQHGADLNPLHREISLGQALLYSEDKAAAVRYATVAAEKSPHWDASVYLLGAAQVHAGDYELGLVHIKRSFELTAHPEGHQFLNAALGLLGLGRHEECLAYATEAVRRGHVGGHTTAAHALMALGRPSEARGHIAELADKNPRLTLDRPMLRYSFICDPKVHRPYIERLREAGLPERNSDREPHHSK